MHIHIYLFPVLNFLLLMHLPRIASTIQISIHICWLMKEHPLVSTLSAVWQCSWHPFWRPEQPIERTCKWWQALIERHGILEMIIIYIYVLLKKNVVIKKKVNENARMAAKTMWMMEYAKSNNCILWVHPWQNEHQRSVNNFRSCMSGNWKFILSWLYIIKVLAAYIGKSDSATLPTSSSKWASTERQQLLFMLPG